jgi:hypothetical protein
VEAIEAGSKAPRVAEALKHAAEADRLARRFDAAAATWLLNQTPAARPAKTLRELQLSNLLFWLAQRTKEDHWFAESDSNPYYATAAKIYIDDAKQLACPKEAFSASIDDRQSELSAFKRSLDEKELVLVQPERPETLKASGPGYTLSVQWQVSAQKGVPAGRPVAGLQIPDVLSAASPESLRTRPLAKPVNQTWIPTGEWSVVTTNKQFSGKPSIDFRLFYRGQEVVRRVPVDYDTDLDLVVHHYVPDNAASLAFRAAPGALEGHLTILLDGSPSMADGDTEEQPITEEQWKKGTPCKYREATAELEAILKQIPPDTTVTVWQFSRRLPDGTTEVKQIDQKVVTRGVPGEFNRILREVNGLDFPAGKNQGRSPIARAMVEAMEKDLKPIPSGLKTLLVLTDGCDNESYEEKQTESLSIPDYLKEKFKGTGVMVRVILFRPSKKELDIAKKQFEKLAEDLTPPGQLFGKDKVERREDIQRLPRYLRDAILPRAELKKDGKPLKEFDKIPVTYGDAAFHWAGKDTRLAPGKYDTDIYGPRRSVELERGDRLLLNVTKDAGLDLRRLLLADYKKLPDERTRKSTDNRWIASVFQNYYSEGKLEQLITIESSEDPNDKIIRLVRPHFCWFEVDPQEGSKSNGFLEWYNDERIAAPAYKIQVANWPVKDFQPRRPELAAWWSVEGPPVHANMDVDLNAQKTVEIDGQAIDIRAELKKKPVKLAPDREEPQDCLVVTVSGRRSDAPVWVSLASTNSAVGEEHRYYKNGTSTATFWGAPAEQGGKPKLHLTSIRKFKDECTRAGTVARFDQLRAPTTDEAAPGAPYTELGRPPEK